MVAQERSHMSFSDMYQEPVEMVKEYPLSSMMVLFGVGMGVGLILSHAFSESSSQPGYMSSILGDRLAKQVQDTASQILPEMISRHLHA